MGVHRVTDSDKYPVRISKMKLVFCLFCFVLFLSLLLSLYSFAGDVSLMTLMHSVVILTVVAVALLDWCEPDDARAWCCRCPCCCYLIAVAVALLD